MAFQALTKMEACYVEWAFVACTFFLICLRLYFQWTRKGWLYWADGFIVLAWFFFAFQTAADWTIAYFAVDTEVIKVSKEDGTTLGSLETGRTEYLTIVTGKLKYAENVTYYGCLYMVKFAWLCFFHTLIPRALPSLRITYWVVTVVSVVGFFFTVLINTFYCMPISSRWAVSPGRYCSNANWVWDVIMTLHSFTDIIIYVLPILLVRHLHILTRRNRLGVALLFALGFICVGWAFTLQGLNLSNVPGSVVCICGAFEQSWAIFVVCLPSFRSLLISGLGGLKLWSNNRNANAEQQTDSKESGSAEDISRKGSGGEQRVQQRVIESNALHVCI